MSRIVVLPLLCGGSADGSGRLRVPLVVFQRRILRINNRADRSNLLGALQVCTPWEGAHNYSTLRPPTTILSVGYYCTSGSTSATQNQCR